MSHPFRQPPPRRRNRTRWPRSGPGRDPQSPVAFRPFAGRDAIRELFGVLIDTFEDFATSTS